MALRRLRELENEYFIERRKETVDKHSFNYWLLAKIEEFAENTSGSFYDKDHPYETLLLGTSRA